MRSLTVIFAAVPAGLATGLAAWLVAGGATSAVTKLEPIEQEVAALRAPRPPSWTPAASIVANLVRTPLFALSVGPGAVAEPMVRLEGVSITRRRTAALLSFDGGPAEWMNLGESRGGVTLQQVAGSKVVLDTVLGAREVALGEQIGGASAPVDVLPPGVRAPLPPASAPGVQ